MDCITLNEEKNERYWVIKKRPEKLLNQLIAGNIDWSIDRKSNDSKPNNMDSVKKDHYFLVFKSENKFRFFCAIGRLVKKEENEGLTGFVLSFKKLDGAKGFTGFKNFVDIDRIENKIKWKPSEGSIQKISEKILCLYLKNRE